MKPLPRGASALEVLIVVALVAFLNLLAAEQYRVQLARVMAQRSALTDQRNRLLLDDGRACVTAGWGSEGASCAQPSR
ncbi:MAG TPA: hypothetical protein PKC59_08135 [Burkholderiaceae bacterium]|nr:hypothetical protein [Burkholderiaceae bacterium]HMX10795.1 hypothetical protein [Burkholderiaceae bacterium]HMZ00206.1 hypothetical protein [Burkholderiaceae bacterium]HNB44321.1 hypothetical protein [Burkholderiaceae bacterium]